MQRLRHIINFFFYTALFLLVLSLGLVSMGAWLYTKDGPHKADVTLAIPKGSGVIEISQILAREGVIDNTLLFRATLLYKPETLKYGEYVIPAQASMEAVMGILADGKAIQRFVTIPEGFTSWQVVERLNNTDFLDGKIKTPPPEGSVAPNTYSYERNKDRNEILSQMVARQKDLIEKIWAERDSGIPLEDADALVTMASIIDRETNLDTERALVASVFYNRIEKDMKLQTDPSVIYGITLGVGGLGHELRRSELEKPTPYNTYVIEGLPPSPISNPGEKALYAAAHPADTEYLYFVADGTGGHAFATNLEDHNKNVALWRAWLRAHPPADEAIKTDAKADETDAGAS